MTAEIVFKVKPHNFPDSQADSPTFFNTDDAAAWGAAATKSTGIQHVIVEVQIVDVDTSGGWTEQNEIEYHRDWQRLSN